MLGTLLSISSGSHSAPFAKSNSSFQQWANRKSTTRSILAIFNSRSPTAINRILISSTPNPLFSTRFEKSRRNKDHLQIDCPAPDLQHEQASQLEYESGDESSNESASDESISGEPVFNGQEESSDDDIPDEDEAGHGFTFNGGIQTTTKIIHKQNHKAESSASA